MDLPEWAGEAIELHSILTDRGIDVACEYNEELDRVEAVCLDVPSTASFPVASWYVLEEHYNSLVVGHYLHNQAKHIEEFLNGH